MKSFTQSSSCSLHMQAPTYSWRNLSTILLSPYIFVVSNNFTCALRCNDDCNKRIKAQPVIFWISQTDLRYTTHMTAKSLLSTYIFSWHYMPFYGRFFLNFLSRNCWLLGTAQFYAYQQFPHCRKSSRLYKTTKEITHTGHFIHTQAMFTKFSNQFDF